MLTQYAMELLACNQKNQTSLDPGNRPYILRFFKDGKVEPYVIGYSILRVSVLFTKWFLS